MCLSAERPLSLCVCETLIFSPLRRVFRIGRFQASATHTRLTTQQSLFHTRAISKLSCCLIALTLLDLSLASQSSFYQRCGRNTSVASVCPTSVCRLKFNIVLTREMYSPPSTAVQSGQRQPKHDDFSNSPFEFICTHLAGCRRRFSPWWLNTPFFSLRVK